MIIPFSFSAFFFLPNTNFLKIKKYIYIPFFKFRSHVIGAKLGLGETGVKGKKKAQIPIIKILDTFFLTE